MKEWIGTYVELYTVMVDAFGEVQPAIRIRAGPKPVKKKEAA